MNPAASIAASISEIDLKDQESSLTRGNVLLLPILAVAFFVRCVVRFSYGEAYFWKNSYSLFYDLAQSIAKGRGLSYEWMGIKYAHRPPVYPLILAATNLSGRSYITIVILQSVVGAGTTFCSYLIGRQLFDKSTGLLAAFGVALYPYFIMHDTALQETGVFTFLTAVAVLLLLRSRTSASKVAWLMAGVSLALAVLTRTTLIAFVPFAFVWVLLVGNSAWRRAMQKTGAVVLGFLLALSPWLLRNYLLLGSPTLSTLSGFTLWAGNNPYTFSDYPVSSIDRSTTAAWNELPASDRAAVQQLANDEVKQNSWFISKAVGYMKDHPGETFARAFKKLGAAFSWRQNPGREKFVQTVYFLSYVPALLLGIFGAWLLRRKWKEHSLIYGLFISFMMVTAVFFAHTSHRSFLDVYLLIFAAYAVRRLYEWAAKTRLVSLPETRNA